jgi:uncharacterized protein involved in outer membrane biogenesis
MKLKWILTALLAIVVALVVAVYIAITQIDPESYRGEIEAQAETATGRKLTLAGPMDLKISLTPAITMEDVSFANAAWGSRENMVTLKRLEVEIAVIPLLSGDIQIKRLVLVEPDILLEVNEQGDANWTFDTATAKEVAEKPTAEEKPAAEGGQGGGKLPVINAALIENAQLVYRDAGSGQETRLALVEMRMTNEGLGTPLDMSLEGRYQEVPFEFSGTIGSFVSLSADNPYPIDVSGSFAGAEITLSGQVGTPMSGPQPDLEFSVEGESLAAFNPVAGGGLPPLGPYALSGRLGGAGETYKISELSAKVGESDLSGDVTLALGGARPSVAAQLSSTLLDMADFSADEAKGEGADSGAGGGKSSKYVFTEDPLPLEGLRAADADVSVKVATLRVNDKLALTDVDLPLALKAGDLTLGPAKAGLSGGVIDLKLDLAGSKATPNVNLALDAADIDYGRLLREQGVTEDVQGTVGADIKLSGAGTTARAVASGLNGQFQIVGDEGVINNKLLAIVSAGLSEVMGPLMGSSENSKLHCVVARFDVKQGVAKSQAILLDTETFTIAGDGDIDLRTEEMDLYFNTETRKASLASLAVPFRMTGMLKSPKVTPDPVGTALKAAKLAGTVANPLVGLGALVAEEAVSGDENPCVAALERTETTSGGTGGGITKDAGDAVKGATEGIEKGIKSLFGD